MNLRQTLLHLEDRLEFREEPLVNVRHLPDLDHRVPAMERRRDRKNALIRRVDELLINILDIVVLHPHPISHRTMR